MDRLSTIGVLGGMGPAATVAFFASLIAKAEIQGVHQKLRIIIDNDPMIPDRNAAIRGNGPSPGLALASMAKRLIKDGAEILVMPCNAAHAFASSIERVAPRRLVSIIEVSARAAADAVGRGGVAGVLATNGTLEASLYQDALSKLEVSALVPSVEDQAKTVATVAAVQAGRASTKDRLSLIDVTSKLIREGAQCIVAGCTEIPTLINEMDLAVPFISSSDALADAALARALAFL